MDTVRWNQIGEIFNKALALESAQRGTYLAEVCRQDELLGKEVESLITSLEEESSFLQTPVFEMGLKVLAVDKTRFSPGDSIGTYTVLSILGSGGMGTVYLAHDPRLGRKVALKLLVPSLTKDQERGRRFRQEARVASKISHPNVASIYEIGEVEEHPYIAMEFVDGMTLRERLQRGPVSLDQIIDIVLQTGRAIEAAHAVGVIHRDIKPENIMIRPDGYVKVLDFGLAKLTDEYAEETDRDHILTRAQTTEPGMLMGTVNYMSPEQVRGQPVDSRTDIWSWGVVLYEMIAGEAPFRGATGSDVLAEILKAEPASLPPSLPASLQEVVRRCLSKAKEGRYAGIREALDQLQRLRKKLETTEDSQLIFEPDPVDSKKDLFTSRIEAGQSDRTRTPPITDSHVIADNFATIDGAGRRRFNTVSEDFSAISKRNRVAAMALVLGVALLALAVFALQRLFSGAIPNVQLQFTKLAIKGNIKEAAISPDGKYVATITDEVSLQSIWLRQISTANDLQLVPPAAAQYKGLTFSPDGDYLYYLKATGTTADLQRVSVLGGAIRRLAPNVDTAVTFSPDGKGLAFLRQFEDSIALIAMNPEGAEQRPLVTLKPMLKLSAGLAWSPDGRVIACVAQNFTPGSDNDLITVQVSDGTVKKINGQSWSRIEKLVWLSDNSGILLDANDQRTSPFQLWLLSYPNGEARRVTNDPNSYLSLSSTKDSKMLLTTNVDHPSRMWIVSDKDRIEAKPITSSEYRGSEGVSWTPDGRIVYTSKETGTYNIWVMNSDGGGHTQLTFDNQRNVQPAVSPDGRYIVFVSYGTGKPHIWRMDLDGTNLRQLTNDSYEGSPRFSPDGKFVIYYNGERDDGIRRISIDGGAPEVVIGNGSIQPDISPKGDLIACFSRGNAPESPWKMAIVSTTGSHQIRTFDLEVGATPVPGIRWTPDGRSVSYVVTSGEVSNIWNQPVSGGYPKQLTNFQENQILSFDWSSIANQLVCVRGAETKDILMVNGFR